MSMTAPVSTSSEKSPSESSDAIDTSHTRLSDPNRSDTRHGAEDPSGELGTTGERPAVGLGRPLANNATQVIVNLTPPGSLYGDRLNQLDLRVGKVIRAGRSRTVASLDVYNALNGNAILTQSNTYANWQAPQSILTARFAKVSLQFDF